MYVGNIFLTNPYISANNNDNDTKLSGYDPWGLQRSSMLSREKRWGKEGGSVGWSRSDGK